MIRKCKYCYFSSSNLRELGAHKKATHPAEWRKDEKVKQEARDRREARNAASEPEPDVATDPELQTIQDCIAAIEVVDEEEMPLHALDARARILKYVANRVGVDITVNTSSVP